MTDTDEEKLWDARLERVLEEHSKLTKFAYEAEETGLISEAAQRAFMKAVVAAMRRGGLINGLEMQKTEKAVHTTVVAQALHEGRLTLLKFHPEIADALEKAAPPSRGGRSL